MMPEVMRFGDCELDLARFELRRGGRRVRVQPKVLDLLVYLIRHRERVVPRDELLAAVWPGVVVSETALSQTVKEARRAVRDDGVRQGVIQTVRGRGYRFVAPVEESPAAEARRHEEPFVGRASVLQQLAQALAAARAGRGRAVLLCGEPGIGKSRTASEFAASARAQGVCVLLGRCIDGQGAPAHWPWTQILRAALRQGVLDRERDLAPDVADIVVRALPGLREELPRHPEPQPAAELSDDQARFRLADALGELFTRAAERAPLLVVVDDLHAADHSSLHLMRNLLRDLGDVRILVVATYREAEMARDPARALLMADVARVAQAFEVRLEGLSSADVGQLTEVLTGQPAAPGLSDWLCDRTGGNPFFLKQILKVWEAGGLGLDALRRDLPLPQGVRDAITRHLDILPEASRDVLSRASVIGREFDLDVLAHVSGVGVDSALETLESAVDARVVRPVGDSWTRFEFAHALIPETLYDAMSPPRRLRLHARVGRALEALRPEDTARAGEIAYHFAKAAPVGEAAAAIRHAKRAGELATRQLAYEDAVLRFEQALATLPYASPDEAQRLDLLLLLSEARGRVGDVAGARTTYQQAAVVARERGDAEALARAALGIDWNIVRRGEVGTDPVRLALLAEALGAVGPRETPLRVRLMAALDEALYFEDQPAAGPPLSLEALKMARRLDDPDALVFALNRRHMLLRNPDGLDERLAVSTELASLARRRRDPDLIFDAHGSQLHDALERGEARLVDEALETFEHLAREHRLPKYLWYAELYRGMRDLARGAFEDAEQCMLRAWEMGQRVQPDLARLWRVGQMQVLRIDQGRAGEFLPEVREVARLYPLPVMQLSLALCEALTGYTGPARRALDRVVGEGLSGVPRDISWVFAVSLLAELAALLRHEAAAKRLYEALAPFADRHIVVGTAIAYRGSVACDLGRLAGLLQRFEEAAAHFGTALASERRMGALPLEARVQCMWAETLLERGDAAGRLEARERLAEAGALAARVGAGLHQARVAELCSLAGA
jgi:DNA-binding winged helix-turn-helix (wHTH) protein/tetratricopeptide (TPR) repeat protein